MEKTESNGVNDPVFDSARTKSDGNSIATKASLEKTLCVDPVADNAIDTERASVGIESSQEGHFDKNRLDEAPDGGYGWVVVIGAFLCPVVTFGIATSVMQDYYEQKVFGETVPNSVLQLSFVGTLALVIANIMSPVAQVLASYWSNKLVLIIGTFFVAIGLIMAGFSTKIWHLYLTQGICFGIGVAFLYMPVISVTPQWFTKRRGLALGIVASGSGIGGLIMPFIMNAINERLGAPWTYRILGFIAMFISGIACILIRERNPKGPRKSFRHIIEFSVLKEGNYVLWVVAAAVQLMGYYVPFFFIPSYATWCGLSQSQGSSLVAVSSACNFVGRIICGIVADRIGVVNTNIIFLVIAALSTLLIWTFAYTYGSLMAYCAVFGIFCGSFFSLMPPITASLLGMERLPSGLSTLLVLTSFTIFFTNVASAIEDSVHAEPFFSYKMFSGVVFLVAALLMTILKLRLNRNPFRKV